MKFLAVSTNIGDPRPFIAEEMARMGELERAGQVQAQYLKADWSGAVLIVDAADAAAARGTVDSLPLVRHGVTRFELTALASPTPPAEQAPAGSAAG